MSLTQFVSDPEVHKRMGAFYPEHSRTIPVTLKAVPCNGAPGRIGTAFDYLLRFELGRRKPDCEEDAWVAEKVGMSPEAREKVNMPFQEAQRLIEGGAELYGTPDGWWSVVRADVARAIQNAKADVAEYRKLKSPSIQDQKRVAAHALVLANLDPLRRSPGVELAANFNAPSREEIDDLIALLRIVPFDKFDFTQRLLLNPAFEKACVISADADLILGDAIIDIKVIRAETIKAEYCDQLLGYHILARHQRIWQPTFPEINRLAIYSARHGYLWSWDVSHLRGSQEFEAFEEWFIARAHAIFGTLFLSTTSQERAPSKRTRKMVSKGKRKVNRTNTE
jgi:hypothetical protein